VIRGDDHVSNTPRQVLIYRALGWEPPVFAHIPMILGADRQRLSKRHGATSVDQYHEQGYLANALVNFLSLLSWSSETGDEVLSRERLIQEFDFNRITRSSAVFDVEKLNWMNGLYIRALEPETLAKCLLPYSQSAGFPVQNATDLLPIAKMVQEKMERLSEFAEKAKVFFQEAAVPENDAAKEILAKESSKAVFEAFLNQTKTLSSLDRNSFMELMKTIQKETGVKGKDLWMPVRIALAGQEHGPDLPGMVEYFGLEKCRRLVAQTME
jgi:nondiscriminating glutamyl-tRNA synthetase